MYDETGYGTDHGDILDMSVYRPVGTETTEDEVGGLERALQDAIERGEITPSDIARDPRGALRTLEHFASRVDEFYHDPERIDELKAFLRRKGYHLKDPTHIGVFDDNPNAVARTDTEKLLEANVHYLTRISDLSTNYGLRTDEGEELVITHELIHNAQPENIKRAHPFPYIAELDVEQKLAEHFYEKAMRASGEQRERYTRIGNAAYTRYQEIYQGLAGRGHTMNMLHSAYQAHSCCGSNRRAA